MLPSCYFSFLRLKVTQLDVKEYESYSGYALSNKMKKIEKELKKVI